MIGENIGILNGVGPKSLAEFNKMGVYTIDSLIHFYPRAYVDWSNFKKIEEVYMLGSPGCIKVKIISNVNKFLYIRNPKIVKLKATDGENDLDIVFFNQFYSAVNLVLGKEAFLYGKVDKKLGRYEIVSPKISKDSIIEPVYPQTRNITSKKIKNLIKAAIDTYKNELIETLPENIRKKYNLCSIQYAITNIHSPQNMAALEIAKRRLIFEELLVWQISMAMIKNYIRRKTDIVVLHDYTKEFLLLLPFIPTNAQTRAIKECMKDMMYGNGLAMGRILQGDVGSGKTVVAAALAYNIVKNGYQVAIMVPTEILSVQHYNTFSKIMNGMPINIGLLSGKLKSSERKKIEEKIKSGEIDIVIGTHALISDKIQFLNLGLIITDEQHRFGVKQRMRLAKKGNNPHTMIMSATPIPRTLSMVLYGDLDISILDELPPGRKLIETFLIDSSKRKRAFGFLKKIVDSGAQGYIICPAIQENEEVNLASIESYINKTLSEEFRGYTTEIIHGKMPTELRENVMQKFAEGSVRILISTTVIEVGVDVPNASLIIIENAERFGLSQLHQLRGRVGRGANKSYCILISDSKSKETISRLKALCNTNDGFYLANKDLDLRGPGEVFGTKQHGLVGFKLAKTSKDMAIVKDCKDAVKHILSNWSISEKSELKYIKKKVMETIIALENK